MESLKHEIENPVDDDFVDNLDISELIYEHAVNGIVLPTQAVLMAARFDQTVFREATGKALLRE